MKLEQQNIKLLTPITIDFKIEQKNSMNGNDITIVCLLIHDIHLGR